MALILGTAQLGQTYGIANRTGQPDAATAHAVIATAWERGIRAFDTAPGYGDAEHLLGEAFTTLGVVDVVRVTTKLEPDVDVGDRQAIMAAVQHSRARLRIQQIQGLLVRRALLNAWESVRHALRELVADGVVERVGISVYTPEEALRALVLEGVSFIQVPTSILDRRFLAAGVFDRALEIGKRVVVRSVFLQGLLTMRSEEVTRIAGAREALEGLRHAVDVFGGITPIALALAYVRERCPDADVLIGAEAPPQVTEIAACWAGTVPTCADIIERYVAAGTSDLVDPTRWNAAHR